MDLIPAKNHAENFDEVIERLQEEKKQYKHRVEGAEITIQFLYFLRDEVDAPPQWFVMSHGVPVIVMNETYYGRVQQIKIVAYPPINRQYKFVKYQSDKEPKIYKSGKYEYPVIPSKEIGLFDNQQDAKEFLEEYLGVDK